MTISKFATKFARPRAVGLAALGAAALALSACYYGPPPPGPVAVAPGYGYAYPGYYAAPVVGSVDVGIGGGYRGGWGGGGWGGGHWR